MTDLKFNYPSLPEEADILAAWMHRQHDLQRLLTYPPVHGLESTREVARQWMNLDSKYSDVVIGNSGNHALACIIRTLELHSTGIVTDPFTYPAFKSTVNYSNIKLHSAAVDSEGLTPEGVEEAIARTNANTLYLQPTIHNPTCAVMSIERRQKIVSLARQKHLLIIEDDAYRFLHPSPPPAFLELYPEGTIHVNSLSKPFNPLLKVAFIATPNRFVNDITNHIRLSSSGNSSLITLVAEEFIQSGVIASMIQKKQEHAKKLQQQLSSVLQGLVYQSHSNSFHLWLTLPQGVSSSQVSEALSKKDILIPSGSDFETVNTGEGERHIRVALAAERNFDRLTEALIQVSTYASGRT